MTLQLDQAGEFGAMFIYAAQIGIEVERKAVK